MQVTFVISYHGSVIEASAESVVFTRRIKLYSRWIQDAGFRNSVTCTRNPGQQEDRYRNRTPYRTPIDPLKKTPGGYLRFTSSSEALNRQVMAFETHVQEHGVCVPSLGHYKHCLGRLGA